MLIFSTHELENFLFFSVKGKNNFFPGHFSSILLVSARLVSIKLGVNAVCTWIMVNNGIFMNGCKKIAV